MQTAVYRILQEALANVGRHAGATAVAVEIEADGERLELRVRDDGAGFDPAALARGANGDGPAPGSASSGMAERARLAGGELDVRSAPGGGTTVTLRIAELEGAVVIRVLIADDHGIVRSGLRMLIERQPDMEVVAEAEDGVAALESTQAHRPTSRCSTCRCRA